MLPPPPPVQLHPGMRITHSVVVERKEYNLAAKDEIKTPSITISGSNITVDFNGATLQGTSRDTPPDQRKGLAILIENAKGVTLKNAHIHGYKLAILAKNSTGLHLTNCDWSYNWKQHLKSTLAKEDESDWMSFHHNEHDEWIYGNGQDPAYGAGGAYLTDCKDFEIDHCRNTGSQCGLMMNRCTGGSIWGNDFSFLSAIGIGLYRSSHNTIQQNRIDYCVRGYSHGVYSRGQDSAGILVYEQSGNNTFAYNSATHGGDGFFLWAGQSTMDTGEGGCNDNLIFENDFSHSPANGIEATFSWNTIIGNRLIECWHGIWGGYSYDTPMDGNLFQYCGQAVAVEHGQNNSLKRNEILDCDDGIVLWAKPVTDQSWGYPKHRDVASHSYSILEDYFGRIAGDGISIGETREALIHGCTFNAVGWPLHIGEGETQVHAEENFLGSPAAPAKADILEQNTNAKLPHYMTRRGSNILENDPTSFLSTWPATRSESPQVSERAAATEPYSVPKKPVPDSFWRADLTSEERGRKYILVNEWGPYDFRSPILWPRGNGRYEILGPKGRWKVVSSEGAASVSPHEGSLPAIIVVESAAGTVPKLTLEFKGDEIVTPVGKRIPPGTPYLFIG